MRKNLITVFIFFLFIIIGFVYSISIHSVFAAGPTPTGSTSHNSFYSYDARNNNFNAFKFAIERGCPNCDLTNPQNGQYPNKSFTQLIDDYDTQVLLQSIQGIVNQDQPVFYIIQQEIDQTWLDKLKSSNIWLNNMTQIPLSSIDNVIDNFKSGYGVTGAVVWTAEKPFTLDMAFTIAGVENYIVVRKNSSLYQKVVDKGITIRRDLSIENYPSKRAAYQEMINEYVNTGRVNPILAYVPDGYELTNMLSGKIFSASYQVEGWTLFRNLAVKHKAFMFDVAPNDRVIPSDEPNQLQGEDYQTFNNILDTFRSRVPQTSMLQVGGYPSRKYNTIDCNGDGKIDEADAVGCLEWATQHLISSKGAYLKGLAAGDLYGVEFANGSFYEHGPVVSDLIPQTSPLTPQQLINMGYLLGNPDDINSLSVNPQKKFVLFYLGDYDSAIPLYTVPLGVWPYIWNHRSSSLPVAWGFAGEAKEYIPSIYSYYAQTTRNIDSYIMPDSGVGYNNPGRIPDQYVNAWINESTTMNRELSYRLGFLINGDTWGDIPANNDVGKKIRNMYKIIAPEGILYPAPVDWPRFVDEGLAVIPITDFSWAGKDEGQAATDLRNFTNGNNQFFAFRNIYVSPDYLNSVVSQANIPDLAVIDPVTFMYLFKLKNANQRPVQRMTVLSENIPSQVTPGQTINATMRIRNDGWETWRPATGGPCDQSQTPGSGCNRVAWVLQNGSIIPSGPGKSPNVNYDQRIELNGLLHPGETMDLNFTIRVPSNLGDYTFQADSVTELAFWGEYLGNQPWQKKIYVTVAPSSTPIPPTSTPIPPTLKSCNSRCFDNNECQSGLCKMPGGPVPNGSCRNPSCSDQPDCNCVPPTSTPIPPTSTPIPPTSTPVPPSLTSIPPTSTPTPTPTPTPIPGDITGPFGFRDGKVNIYDYNKLIGDFGKSNSPADIDGSGVVDIYDYNTLIGNFGK